MLWAIGFLVTFLFGGLTGIILASPPLDFHVSDSYFVVAHFHYVVFGTVVFAMFAGFYFWWPKFTGKMLDERLGKVHFWMLFIGFHGTFLVQHWLGVEGFPRRYADYRPGDGFTTLNMVSSVSSFLLGASTLVFLYNVWKTGAGPRPRSRSTTRGAGVGRWSGRRPVRRRGTTSSAPADPVGVAGVRPAPPGAGAAHDVHRGPGGAGGGGFIGRLAAPEAREEGTRREGQGSCWRSSPLFLGCSGVVYWLLSHEPAGTTALILCAGLTALIGYYLLFTERRLQLQPDDDPVGDIDDGGGVRLLQPAQLVAAAAGGGRWRWCSWASVFGWWLSVIGAALGTVALIGFVFEYYRGEHAH